MYISIARLVGIYASFVRKAIDFVQEHVLKEGPQNNESAIEQAKDKKIADTIRAAIGHPKK